MRTSRPKTPVIYGPDETFPIGGSKVAAPERATTWPPSSAPASRVFEALKALRQLKAEGIAIRVIDLYSLQPIDAATLHRGGQRDRAAGSSRSRITTRPAASATRSAKRSRRPGFAVHRLAVREIPRSGTAGRAARPLRHLGQHIVEAVKSLL